MPNKFTYRRNCMLLLLLFVLLPAGALAAKVSDLWVTPFLPEKAVQTGNAQMPLDAVRWWYSGKEKVYYLFLPAGVDQHKWNISAPLCRAFKTQFFPRTAWI